MDSNRQIAWTAVAGAARNALADRQRLRYQMVRDTWSTVKRFGATGRIDAVEIREMPCICDQRVEAFIDDPNRGVLAALCKGIGAETFLEIGTNRGRTAWSVARTNPGLTVYTLDLPSQEAIGEVALDVNASDRGFFVADWDRGDAFADTPVAERIEQLWGDSATFDFSPYAGRIDVVFIDGAHSYSYVRNDTEAAFEMLADGGVIAWDDYPAIPGVYRALVELADERAGRLVHIRGTRLVIYSERDLVERVADYGELHEA